MLELPWSPGLPLPVWIAGYGPVALKLTGRIADGSMLQIGDPDLIRWFVSQVRDVGGRGRARPRRGQGHGRRAGPRRRPRRRPRSDPLVPGAREQPRRRPREQVPARGPARGADDVRPHREGYDYHHHAEVGSDNAAFVTDEIVDRFCLVGSAEDHLVRLRELERAGVDQFNLYLMNGNEEEQLELYGRDIIPAMRGAPAADPGSSALEEGACAR